MRPRLVPSLLILSLALGCGDDGAATDAQVCPACPDHSTCVDGDAGLACECDEGFVSELDGMDSSSCVDVDECLEGNGGCVAPMVCVNAPGAFACECPVGTEPDGDGGCDQAFDIVVEFIDEPSDELREAFATAEARWEALIVGNLPTQEAPIDPRCEAPAGASVDDIYIAVRIQEIDSNNGVLGRATPICYREIPDTYLPITARMEIDSHDIDRLVELSRLETVVTHEMGHALGIGSGWDNVGLIENPACTMGDCMAGRDVRYLGELGNAGWALLAGEGDKAPVENALGAGALDTHWREASPLRHELMSSQLSSNNTLSIMSLRTLGDLGYPIGDDGAAEPYMLSITSGAEPPPTPMLGCTGESPGYRVRADGTIVE